MSENKKSKKKTIIFESVFGGFLLIGVAILLSAFFYPKPKNDSSSTLIHREISASPTQVSKS